MTLPAPLCRPDRANRIAIQPLTPNQHRRTGLTPFYHVLGLFQSSVSSILASTSAVAPSATVTMPEAAVDKDDFSPRREHEFGRSGQIATVQSIAIPEAMQQMPQYEFWFGVLLADLRHDEGTAFRCDVVGHFRNTNPAAQNVRTLLARLPYSV